MSEIKAIIRFKIGVSKSQLHDKNLLKRKRFLELKLNWNLIKMDQNGIGIGKMFSNQFVFVSLTFYRHDCIGIFAAIFFRNFFHCDIHMHSPMVFWFWLKFWNLDIAWEALDQGLKHFCQIGVTFFIRLFYCRQNTCKICFCSYFLEWKLTCFIMFNFFQPTQVNRINLSLTSVTSVSIILNVYLNVYLNFIWI